MPAGSAIRAAHLEGDDRVQTPYCLRCQQQVVDACLARLAGFAQAVDPGLSARLQ